MNDKKVGRNAPCPCGSQKKYKKCCLDDTDNQQTQSISQSQKRASSRNTDSLLMTTTHEPHMPIRLYYTVQDKNALIRKLRQLKCVQFHSDDDAFFINYTKEARNFGLSIPHHQVPKMLYPIILAEGHFTSAKTLLLDLRSFERGARMIEFMDKHIDRAIAKITHAATYNRIHRANASTLQTFKHVDYDALFAEKNLHIIDPMASLEKLQQVTAHTHDQDEKLLAFEAYFEQIKSEKIPQVEKFPIHYYEEGISSFEIGSKLRIMLAYEHVTGNTKCTLFQMVEKLVKSFYQSLKGK